ncbi:MAG: hypothetical protein JO301_13850 [Chitinophagaceae bacterium]|nr:hypothetical protein [Chitinophagaceae bacterium]
MQIRFTKHTGKAHTIKYIRDDGTETWMQADEFFIRHDLSHYALEKTLGYKTAFNGMINSGMDIKDFEDRQKRQAMKMTNEAAYAENMANLFLGEVLQGNFEDFNAVQQQTLHFINPQIPALNLDENNIQAVRTCLRQLLEDWEALPGGETMEFAFDI